jgi:hypothetical protein
VRPVHVVVLAVDAEDVLKMAPSENEDPVETLDSERTYPAFGVSVRVRRLDRRADHPDALAAEDLVERVAELRVPVVDEEPERLLVAQLHHEVARLLRHPTSIRIRRPRDVLEWLSRGNGAVWATLANNRGVARVDAVTGDVRYIPVGYGEPFGVAVGGDHAWVATDRAVWKLGATTGEARAGSLIPRAGGAGFVSITYADGAAWLSTYDRGTVVRVR